MSDGDSDEDLELLRQRALSSLAINQKLYYGKSTLPESEIKKLNVPEFTELVVAEGEFSESDVDEIVEEIVMSSEEEEADGGEESDSDLLSLKSEDSFDKILHSLEEEAAKPISGKKSKEGKKIPEAYKSDILDDTRRSDHDSRNHRRDFPRGGGRGSRDMRDGRGVSRDHRDRQKDRRVSSKSRDYNNPRDERRLGDKKDLRETRDVRESHREFRDARDGREDNTSLARHSTNKDKSWDKLQSKSKQLRTRPNEIKDERNEESSVKRKRLMEIPTEIELGIRDLRAKGTKNPDRSNKRENSRSKEEPGDGSRNKKSSKRRHNRKEGSRERKDESPGPAKPKTEFELEMDKRREERLKRFGNDIEEKAKEPKVIKLSKETRKEESKRKDGVKNSQLPNRLTRLKSSPNEEDEGRRGRKEDEEKKSNQDEDLREKLRRRHLASNRLFSHAVDKLNSSISTSSHQSHHPPPRLASEVTSSPSSSTSDTKSASSKLAKGKRKVSIMPF